MAAKIAEVVSGCWFNLETLIFRLSKVKLTRYFDYLFE